MCAYIDKLLMQQFDLLGFNENGAAIEIYDEAFEHPYFLNESSKAKQSVH